MESSPPRLSAVVILSYLTVYLVWGSTYFFIRMAVQTIPPYLLVGLRFSVGGLLLLVAVVVTGRLRPWPSMRPSIRQILCACLMGGMLLFGANGLITVAEIRVHSYIVALVLASTPLAVAAFDWLLFGRRVTGLRLAGIVTGVAGVGLLLYRGGFAATLDADTMLILAAMLLWSFATSLGHRLPLHPDNLFNAAVEMLFAGLASLAVFALGGQRALPALAAASAASLWGAAFLTVFGSVAFTAYAHLLAAEPAIRVVSYALVNPLIATLLGLAAGGESPTRLFALGMPMVIAGLLVMLYGELLVNRLRAMLKGRGGRR
jgi:drug/metabolite transporter (DMT)-like permease